MHHMHGIIPLLFDYWANPVVHLLLLKSSMGKLLYLKYIKEIMRHLQDNIPYMLTIGLILLFISSNERARWTSLSKCIIVVFTSS